MIRDLNYVLDYMNKYIQDKDMQDSEPMLNHKDIELVLRYIQELENRVNKAIETINSMIYKGCIIINKGTARSYMATGESTEFGVRAKELLYILKGGDSNE